MDGNEPEFAFDYDSVPEDRIGMYAVDPVLARRRKQAWTVLFLLLAGGLLAATDPPGGTKVQFFLLGMLTLVVVVTINLLVQSTPSKVARQAARLTPYLEGRQRVLIGPDGLAWARPDGQHLSFGWEAVSRIQVTEHAFVVCGQGGQVLATLPRRAVPPDQADDLARYLQAAVRPAGEPAR